MLTLISVQTRAEGTADGPAAFTNTLFVSTRARQKPSAVIGMTALRTGNQKAAVNARASVQRDHRQERQQEIELRAPPSP